MITLDQARTVRGRSMVGTSGERIGEVSQVFLDGETGQPEWATVATGLLGARESFVPLAEARLSDDSLTVPYTKDRIKGSPSVDADEALSQDEEATLYSYYGLGNTEQASDSGLPATGTTATAPTPTRATGTGTGTGTGGDDDAMTRSEERLHVGTQRVETGRARLRKFVTTEQQSAQVQVSHDEVTLTREPITDANRPPAMEGPQISEAVHEVVLNAETAVVDKEVVPVERIRIGKDTVTETQQVSDSVRKEQVELDEPEGVRERER